MDLNTLGDRFCHSHFTELERVSYLGFPILGGTNMGAIESAGLQIFHKLLRCVTKELFFSRKEQNSGNENQLSCAAK